jgi:hypothetical protein
VLALKESLPFMGTCDVVLLGKAEAFCRGAGNGTGIKQSALPGLRE